MSFRLKGSLLEVRTLQRAPSNWGATALVVVGGAVAVVFESVSLVAWLVPAIILLSIFVLAWGTATVRMHAGLLVLQNGRFRKRHCLQPGQIEAVTVREVEGRIGLQLSLDGGSEIAMGPWKHMDLDGGEATAALLRLMVERCVAADEARHHG